jgi:hypothetical protein
VSLFKLRFNPGIIKDTTNYSSSGSWWDCDKIRFRNGYPETIGGWSKYSDDTYSGVARSLIAWGDLNGGTLVGTGTHEKYYVTFGGQVNDITPIRETTAAGDVTFSASNGSNLVTVSDAGHGAIAGSYVTFSGAVSLGGNVVAGELNKEFSITSIVDINSYTITLDVTANGSDTGNGGGSTVGAYQINVGRQNNVLGLGWGSDGWGEGGWGSSGSTAVGLLNLRIWSNDNFGEDLIINPNGDGIY